MKQPPKQQNRIDLDKMFEYLVENALDFIKRALREIEKAPKYSIIHFYAAVELILKARLMREHWTLLVASQKYPDWDRFVAGDFRSVHLDEANERLHKVVRDGLSQAEFDAFKRVATHRNKIVHFFHAGTASSAKEILSAWHSLHGILTSRWKNTFRKWGGDISGIDSGMRKLRAYLEVVFEKVSPEIAKNAGRSLIYAECLSCGFKSKEHENGMKFVYESKCLVCNFAEQNVNVECDECGETAAFRECGDGHCLSCKTRFDQQYLAGALLSSYAHGKDALEEHYTGNCSECGICETLIRTENEQWICANCLQTFEPESLIDCGWCGTPNTGDMEMSFYYGCDCCGGSKEYNEDRD